MHWCYEQLLPYSGWFAVGGNTIVFGPVDYYLARLAASLGDAKPAPSIGSGPSRTAATRA